MRHLVVLGSGFAGLFALHALEQATRSRRKLKITLVSNSDHFLFTPLLPNVANSELSFKAITSPLRDQIDPSTELVRAHIEAIDADAHALIADSGERIPYDYLLLAPGAVIDWRGQEAFRPHAMTCKSSGDALFIRDQIERAIARAAALPKEARRAALTFVFAGAGPTGVELACELYAGLVRDVFPRSAPELRGEIRFLLVEPGETILKGLPRALAEAARARLDELGIELLTSTRVTQREAGSVTLNDGETLPCEHFFWCAGVKPSPLAELALFDRDAQGRVLTDETLQALGHENIFVAGDIASPPDAPQQNAQAAKQQGPIAAHNILAALSGRAPRAFRFQHLGDMLTLGRGHAAIEMMGVSLKGRLAYGMYRAAYAGLMPGARNKLQILTEWLEHDLATAQLLSLPNLQE